MFETSTKLIFTSNLLYTFSLLTSFSLDKWFSPQVTCPYCLHPVFYQIPSLHLCHIALNCVSSVLSVPAWSHFNLLSCFFSLQNFSALHTIYCFSFSSPKLPCCFSWPICSIRQMSIVHHGLIATFKGGVVRIRSLYW